MHVVIFESDWQSFLPLTFTRPVFALGCGANTLLHKQIRATAPSRLTLWVRPALADFCRLHILPLLQIPTSINTPLDDEPTLLLDARSVYLSDNDREHSEPSVVVDEVNGREVLHQAYVRAGGLSHDDILNQTSRWTRLLESPRTVAHSRLARYSWDLIGWNEETLVADFAQIGTPNPAAPAGPHHLINEINIWLGAGVKLSPGCVLDAAKGPILIADHAEIGTNSVVQGPCFIGAHSQIAPLALIRPGTSIGAMCKVGGEVSNCIILPYTNKAHDGFLGNSYVGEWVNLGAGTITSNLKNTYGQVHMELNGQTIDTGRQFLGSLIGDHTKTAIGTRLMTGSYVGYCCMIATPAYPPKFVPSFSFLTESGLAPYRMDKATEVMKSVFNRRNRPWTTADEEMNQYVASTAAEVEGGHTFTRASHDP